MYRITSSVRSYAWLAPRGARQRTWRGALVRLAALVVWSTLAWGCVSGNLGTPPGTYTIAITGQQGNISHSTQVTLVVR